MFDERIQQAFSAELLNALPVAVFSVAHSTQAKLESQDLLLLTVYANQTAIELFDVNAQCSLAELQQALKFQVDAINQSEHGHQSIDSPLVTTMQGETIDRRDLMLNSLPVQLVTGQLAINHEEQLSYMVIQPRDHRLFVSSGPHMDMQSTELSLKEFIEYEKTVSHVSRSLAVNKLPIEERINQALASIGEFCQVDRAYVFLFDFDCSTMSNTHEWINDGITSHLDELQDIPRSGLPWFFEKITTQGIVNIRNTHELGDEAKLEREEFLQEDIKSILCVGMYADDEIIGFVGFDMVARQRYWSEKDIRRSRMIADLIASSIHTDLLMQSLKTTQRQLLATNESLRRLAMRDSLTGLPSKQQFIERLTEEIARAQRQGHELSLCLFSIDLLQQIAAETELEHYNQLVVRVAELLTSFFRRNGETVSRIEDCTFAVILPHVDHSLAQQRSAELLRRATEQVKAPAAGKLTLSAGLAFMHADINAESLLAQAQNQLTLAKSQGGGKLVS